MGRKLRAEQHGVFPGFPDRARFQERDQVLRRALAKRAGLPEPEHSPFENLGNRELNVYGKKEEIMAAIRDNRIVAIEGETGSGKSTQLGQYAMEMGYKRVIHLVPRILIANNLGDQLQRELSSQLGDSASALVGVHHSERHENPGAPVTVMTPGTFMRVKAQLLEDFADEPILIVGDEIHEKDFETEMAVAVAAKDLAKHPNWRMALVSATMDAKSVDDAYGPLVKGDIPHIHIEGRPHELETKEEPELTAVDAYLKYGGQHDRTIIFTAGKTEIREMIAALDKACASRNVRILPLHAKLPRAQILKATHAELAPGEKLIIVATSAAQSGITIPGLTLSILDGTIRRPNLDEDGTEGLFKEYCAQDELIQEGGRAGRDVGGGLAVLVKSMDERFGFKSLDDRAPQAPAQIYSTNISRNTLLATALGVNFFEVNQYLIHKVDRGRILDAYEVLWRLQAIDEQNEITDVGEMMNQLPLRPELARSFVEAMQRRASKERLHQLIGLVTSVEAGGLQYYEKGASELWKKDIQSHAQDDYIAQLDMFRATRKFYHTATGPIVSHGAAQDDGATYSYNYVDEGALAQRGYDPKNVYRAHHTFDKISRTLGITFEEGSAVKIPDSEAIDELHDYLTAGLFDYAHSKIREEKIRGQPGTVSWYEEVTREGTSERRISDRSRLTKSGPDILIGLPRRYEKVSKGDLQIHNVVEQAMPSSVEKLKKHVMHLLVRRPDSGAQLVSGRLTRTDTLRFGHIEMGREQTRTQLVHTDETREVLTKGVFDKPTQTVTELIDIKRRLEYLARRISPQVFDNVFSNGLLTEEWLHDRINEAITGDVDDIFVLDNNLRAMVVREGISIRTWISEEVEKKVIENSPDYVSLGGGINYPIYWSQGKPIINGFNRLDVDLLPSDGLRLADGREVLFSWKNESNDTKRMSAHQLRAYIKKQQTRTV